MRRSPSPFALVLLALPLSAGGGQDGRAASTNGKRFISETDLFRFQWVADPQISPDGSQVAFVKVSVDAKKEGYETALFLVDTKGGAPRRFTAGPRVGSPRWSPDGKWLAFLRAPSGESGGRPQPAQLHLIAASGGEAWAITDLPRGAGPADWSPEGSRLLFTSTTSEKDLARKGEKPDPARRESDVRVITRAVYRANGPGFVDTTRRTHLWTLEVPKATGELATPKPITSGDFDDALPAWSPDGREVYFVSTSVKEPYYDPPKAELYGVAAGGGERRRLLALDGSIGSFAFSPDGRRIAFRGSSNGSPVRSYNQPDLFVVDNAVGAAPKNLTAGYDFDIGGGLTGDQRAPRGGQPGEVVWSRDGRSILVTVAEHGRANLKRVDAASGAVSPLTAGDREVMAYTASADSRTLALVVSTPTAIGDLFVSDAAGKLTQLTDFNKELFSELHLSEPEEIWYTSFDGKRAHTLVQKPPDFDPKKKYPLILNIHGGPHAAYGYTFDHEFQWMAAKGYVVVYPNPRGSTSYGQDFGNVIQYRYPGDDHKDLMLAVDEVIKRGYVDTAKLGITGGSGGGVLTNWAITQTDRFAAAVSQRSIADWAGFWYTADFTLFQPTWFRKAPWEDPKDFAARSAITFVDRVRTPLMLIEGESDLRTPPSDGGEQMFRALKYRKVPTVMVRFPGETHELSRSGQPWHRVERLQHIVAWFDKYLQGRQTDAYDVK
jgi:dipeptidyl aminopeptidase/acylaminoacyl peptidase